MNSDKIKNLIKEVLEKSYLMSLGISDNDGVWVADVIFIHDDELNIYWMSNPETRHSRSIANNPKVAGSITVSGQGEKNLGVQFEGIAQKIDGERYDLAKKHFVKRKKPEPKEDEDVLDGDSWYIIKPSKIGLINEELFGFDRQNLEL